MQLCSRASPIASTPGDAFWVVLLKRPRVRTSQRARDSVRCGARVVLNLQPEEAAACQSR